MQILIVDSVEKGVEKAKDILYEKVDNKTALFLSGGKTPQPLYEKLAQEKIIKPAAVSMIDERFGEPYHQNSNEKMLLDTGLLTYFSENNISFNSMLQKGCTLQEDARTYDEKVRSVFFHFPNSFGITGIGMDGHTAGIAPSRSDFTNPIFNESEKDLFVSCFSDTTGSFQDRITLTFSGLFLLDFILVFVFGEYKKKALQQVFTQGSLEEIPARIYTTSQLSKKTLFITDQKI